MTSTPTADSTPATFDDDRYTPYLASVMTRATDIVADHGSGQYLWSVEGRRYIDWVQGIAVNALGHCHPRVVDAVHEQTAKLMTASFNLVAYPSTLKLARRIAGAAPDGLDQVFFSNGGAEATDGALKLARVASGKPAIIAFKGSFHGRTVGATSITASDSRYRAGLGPLMGQVHFAPYPSKDMCPPEFDAARRTAYALGEVESLLRYVVAPADVAAIYVEPVQGEGGYVVPEPEFLQGLRAIADKHGILLVFDEIQSGYGRTGAMWAGEHSGVAPDIMTIGKALAGGMPMSAIVSRQGIMDRWFPGTHGTTFGGNPVSAAAGLAVLDEFEASGVVANAERVGQVFKARLEELKARYPVIAEVRGVGMMLAVEFAATDDMVPAKVFTTVQSLAAERGLLLLGCGVAHNAVRFAAPLNSTVADIDEGLEIFESVLATVSKM